MTVAQGIIQAATGISDTVGRDRDARDKFARMLVDSVTSQYPGYDAVAAVRGKFEGQGVHQHAELNYALGLTSQGYEVYAVKQGEQSHSPCCCWLRNQTSRF